MMTSENAPRARASAESGLAPGFDGLGEEVEEDLAVVGGLEDGAAVFEFVAQRVGVDEVAVVGDGDLPAAAVADDGLGVDEVARPGRRITGVPDGARAGEPLDVALIGTPARRGPSPCGA